MQERVAGLEKAIHFARIGDMSRYHAYGTVARTVRPAVQIYFQRDPWWWIGLDAGVNVMSNVDHVKNRSETRFVGLLEFGLRLRLDRAVGLSFP